SFGGPEWSTGLEGQFLAWQQSIGMGRQVVDFLLLPVRVALEGGSGYTHFDGRLNPLWCALVPLSLAAAPSSPPVRRALGVAALYFLTWAATSQQARFLIPILPLLSVAAGVALATMLARVETIGPALYPVCAAGVVGVATVSLLWSARFVLGDGLGAAREM